MCHQMLEKHRASQSDGTQIPGQGRDLRPVADDGPHQEKEGNRGKKHLKD
jgi:hypothetical protein